MDALQTISFRRAALFVACLAVVVHVQAVGHSFTWNDGTNIVDNDRITDPANIPSFFVEAWGATAEDPTYRARNSQYWRPVPLTLWTLEVAAFGLTPAPFHAINVLLHALTAVLVLLLAWRLFSGSTSRAGPGRLGVILGACAWAVHPAHTEVVHVVSYGSDLLAGLFTFAALAVWLGGPDRTPRRERRDLAFTVPLLFALGVGSKEMAVTVPVLLALLDVIAPPRPLTLVDRARRLAPVTLVLVGYLALRASLLGSGGQDFYQGAGALVVVNSMLDVVGLYARLLVVPWPLCPFYDWSILPPQLTLFALGPLMGLLILAAWSAVGVWLWRRGDRGAFAVVLPLVVLVPVSHFVPIIIAAADRFLYVAAAGPLILVAVVAARSRSARVWVSVLAAVIALQAGITVVRGADWRDDRTILEATVRDWPTSRSAWRGLATLHAKEGRAAEAAAIWQRLGVEPPKGQSDTSD